MLSEFGDTKNLRGFQNLADLQFTVKKNKYF
jgi:hypothetical protein